MSDKSKKIDEALGQLPKELDAKEVVAVLLTVASAYAPKQVDAFRFMALGTMVLARDMNVPDDRLRGVFDSLLESIRKTEKKPYIN